MILDLRSDTVTKPTAPMLEAMMNARVGDDVFDEDPTIKELEQKTAELLGHEAGIFCPSGTMTNQIAIKLLTQPQDQVICDKRAHIYNYEGGGMAFNSGVSARLVDGDRGRFSALQVLENINPDDVHYQRTRLVALENTVNKGGGSCYRLSQIEPIFDVCVEHGLKMHLDGARLFNALAETHEDPAVIGKMFNTVSICLSKGLGAPVGSVLVSSAAMIKQARRIRKVFGGGMRQAGYLAAAGIYALDHHVERLSEDHKRARAIAKVLEKADFVDSVDEVETNIVIFTIREDLSVPVVLDALQDQGILAVRFGAKDIRLVTHLEFGDEHLKKFTEIIEELTIHV